MLNGFPFKLPPCAPAMGPCRFANSKKPAKRNVGRTLKTIVLRRNEKEVGVRTDAGEENLIYMLLQLEERLSPVTFTGVEDGYFLCGVQAHFLLNHLQLVFK